MRVSDDRADQCPVLLADILAGPGVPGDHQYLLVCFSLPFCP